MRRGAGAAPRRRQRGFALLIVLWTMVLIAFLVAHLAASGRTEIRIADNLVANAVAQAAADGAIAEAIFDLADPQPERRPPLDGSAHRITVGHSRVTVRLTDEAARINPNLAPAVLMQALFVATGSDAETARRLAAAIEAWTGRARTGRDRREIAAEYRAAGLDYRPPGAPFESLGELGEVVGMTPAILAAIRPHLTLYGPAVPDAADADPVVAAALAQIAPSRSPAAAQPGSPTLTARITATAHGPGNAEVTRTAIVRIGANLPNGHTVLAWRDRIE